MMSCQGCVTRSAMHQRRGFTLLEMVIVITVIIALAGIGIPIYGVINRQMKISSTRAMVALVAHAIEQYGSSRWTWAQLDALGKPVLDGNKRPIIRSGNIFALKEEGQSVNARGDKIPFHTIDGRPEPADPAERVSTATYDGPFPLADKFSIYYSGYRGFYDMTGVTVDTRNNLNAKHQIVDAWGEPLRICYAAGVYGTKGFGVWSPGPDHIDQDTDSKAPRDDLCSWISVDDATQAGR